LVYKEQEEAMSSRDFILNSIRTGKPESKPLREIPFPFPSPIHIDLVEQYRSSLEKNGGKLSLLNSLSAVRQLVSEVYPDAKNIVANVEGVLGTRDISPSDDPHVFRDVDVVIIKGEVAVAENAAIWLSEQNLVHRVLPFITQHLMVVVERRDMVRSMHDAYARIDPSSTGYGVFLAGPSKTADIEQSLVIGAHGARSLLVAIVTD
jgi:L-lactate dehydrogenase complex protein LldG